MLAEAINRVQAMIEDLDDETRQVKFERVHGTHTDSGVLDAESMTDDELDEYFQDLVKGEDYDALEQIEGRGSAYADVLKMLRELQENALALSVGSEASEHFADRITNMHGWYVRLLPREGDAIEAVIQGSGKDEWYDSVVYLPADPETGLALPGVGLREVRVAEVHIY